MRDIQLIENISTVYKRISHAAMRAGRRPEDIKLIAVTKTLSLQRITDAIDAGLRVFGESRIQEALKKVTSNELQVTSSKIEWHLIGHLQKNKAKTAVELFDMIQSIDSIELAKTIDRHALEAGKVQHVLIQVKLSHEDSKHGILKGNFLTNIREIGKLKNLNLRGLMTIPPFSENPEDSRRYFRELRTLRDESRMPGYELPELSMGMTNDFEIAIEEGATMVRIGTAIFGDRK